MIKQLNKQQRKELETPAQELYKQLLFDDIRRNNERLKRYNYKNRNNK